MSDDEKKHDDHHEHDRLVMVPTETVEETVARRDRYRVVTPAQALEVFRSIMRGEKKR